MGSKVDTVFPPLPLSVLSPSPFHCALQDGFGLTWWTGDMTVPLLGDWQAGTRLWCFIPRLTLSISQKVIYFIILCSTVQLQLQRRRSFYILNIILPVLFLSVTSSLTFALPSDSGEKMGLSITVLLAYAVYLTLVTDSMPDTSVQVTIKLSLLQTLSSSLKHYDFSSFSSWSQPVSSLPWSPWSKSLTVTHSRPHPRYTHVLYITTTFVAF